MLLGIAVVSLFDLDQRGIEIVGTIPPARFGLDLPAIGFKTLSALLPRALGISFLIIAESVSAARAVAAHGDRELRPNREMLSLGAANLVAGLVGGFAVSGSVSATQANEQARARTPLSVVVAAGLVFLTGYFATSAFHNLPVAILGAIVIQAVLPLLRLHKLWRLARVVRADFFIALIALFGVLLLHVLTGLLVAILLSIGWLLFRTSRPHAAALGEVAGEEGFDSMDRHPDARPIPGLLIFRLDAPLFFANAALMHDQVIRLLQESEAKAVVLDMELSFRLDSSSIEMLEELLAALRKRSIDVYLARVHAPVREVLARAGFLDLLGRWHVFNTVQEAVDHHRGRAS